MSDLAESVRQAAGRPEIHEAVAGLYADVQAAIDARRPVCLVSGRCCQFEQFGHRLFVTTLELAAFAHELAKLPVARCQLPGETQSRLSLATALQLATSSGCPFQVGKLCGVHTFRPFGCRIFFCDATATEWQNQAYEQFHNRLKQIHESLDVPYFYIEWRAALAALGLDRT